jgi:hypothetical protein
MLGRRRTHSSSPLRSSLAHAAFAVEERVVWGGADVLRAVLDLVKWPFERAVWAIERGLVWPLEKRTDGWSEPLRAAGVAALVLCAIGAGVLGLTWASGSGGGATSPTRQASVPVAPAVATAPKQEPAEAAPVLQGATPDFTPKAGATAAKAGDAAATTAPSEAATGNAAASKDAAAPSPNGSTATATAVEPAGPAATKVARQFADAFVLYEIGRTDAKVRTAFAATATPALSRSLLRRPPRLPANVKVPKAKVLNVVPGPMRGETYTLSVSLLRVGVTSELRLDLQRDRKSGEWQVKDALG